MARIIDNTNQLTGAAWAGDYFDRGHMVPGGARVLAAAWATTAYTITATEPALAAATAITVAALPVAIPAGTILDFLGTGKLAHVTTAAAAGATTLVVTALDAALDDNDTAAFYVYDAPPVTIPSGAIVGRTIAERENGDAFGPAVAGDEVYIVCFDVYDATVNADVELYRPGSIVKENQLPGWASVPAAVKALVRAAYTCTSGAA